jgi:hypothetical protein
MRRTIHDPETNDVLAEIEFLSLHEWQDPAGNSRGWQAELQIISEYPGLRQAESVLVCAGDGRTRRAILCCSDAAGILLQSSSPY